MWLGGPGSALPRWQAASRDERRGEGRGGERRERWIEDDAAGREESSEIDDGG